MGLSLLLCLRLSICLMAAAPAERNVREQTEVWTAALNSATVAQMNSSTLLASNPPTLKPLAMPAPIGLEMDRDLDGFCLLTPVVEIMAPLGYAPEVDHAISGAIDSSGVM